MEKIRNVYISGLGAIGSAFASRIHDRNPECVRVIVNRERKERYEKEGITVNGKGYRFRYVLPDESTGPADLILIAVKQHNLEQSIKDISKFVGEETIILSLLNGISSEEIVGGRLGMDKMLYSFCVGTDAVREGTKVSYSKIGRIIFGDATGRYPFKVEAVREFFDNNDVPYDIPEDIIRELWWKFMLNVGINQASAVLRAPYGVFHNTEEAVELMKAASREAIAVSRKAGVNLDEEDLEKCVRIMRTLSPEGKTSMLQDIDAGRKTEVEIFSGKVRELGRRYGVNTPVNDMLFLMLRTLEKMAGCC